MGLVHMLNSGYVCELDFVCVLHPRMERREEATAKQEIDEQQEEVTKKISAREHVRIMRMYHVEADTCRRIVLCGCVCAANERGAGGSKYYTLRYVYIYIFVYLFRCITTTGSVLQNSLPTIPFSQTSPVTGTQNINKTHAAHTMDREKKVCLEAEVVRTAHSTVPVMWKHWIVISVICSTCKLKSIEYFAPCVNIIHIDENIQKMWKCKSV